MAKRTRKTPPVKPQTTQKVKAQDVKESSGDQAAKRSNRGADGKFLKGNKPEVGFHTNPENIDRSGAGQRAVYNKNLLQQMLLMPLDDEATKQFDKLKELFPNHFKGTEQKNWQFFMELQQLNLVFHKNPNVAQKAMQEIRDRLDGKAIQKVENKISTDVSVESFLGQFEDEK